MQNCSFTLSFSVHLKSFARPVRFALRRCFSSLSYRPQHSQKKLHPGVDKFSKTRKLKSRIPILTGVDRNASRRRSGGCSISFTLQKGVLCPFGETFETSSRLCLDKKGGRNRSRDPIQNCILHFRQRPTRAVGSDHMSLYLPFRRCNVKGKWRLFLFFLARSSPDSARLPQEEL